MKLALIVILLTLYGCTTASISNVVVANQQILTQRGFSFSEYHSYAVRPLRLPGHRIDLESKITPALKYSMKKMALIPSARPTLLLEYSISIEHSLLPETSIYTTHRGDINDQKMNTKSQAKLYIRVTDTRKNEVVWHFIDAKTIVDDSKNQEEINSALYHTLNQDK